MAPGHNAPYPESSASFARICCSAANKNVFANASFPSSTAQSANTTAHPTLIALDGVRIEVTVTVDSNGAPGRPPQVEVQVVWPGGNFAALTEADTTFRYAPEVDQTYVYNLVASTVDSDDSSDPPTDVKIRITDETAEDEGGSGGRAFLELAVPVRNGI